MTKPFQAGPWRLMRCGKLPSEQDDQQISPDLRRGMMLLTRTGEELGTIAAVVENAAGEVSGLLLVRSQKQFEYRLVPVHLIDEVGESAVTLQIDASAVAELAIYQAEH